MNATSNKTKRIISFLKWVLIIIGALLLLLGYTLFGDLIEHWKEIITQFLISLGTTCLGIGIINIFYQQWKDEEEENLPSKLRDAMRDSIEDIATQTANQLHPVVPAKLYPKCYEAGEELKMDLREKLKSTSLFFYTGISMSVTKQCIDYICDNKSWERDVVKMKIIIPFPNIKTLDSEEIERIKNNAKAIVAKCKKCKQVRFTLEFIFLRVEPSFHIHLTEEHCWFAFADRGQNDSKNNGEEKERCDYPATYLYKNYNKHDDTEMYDTIKHIVEDLEDHGYIKYTLKFGNSTKESEELSSQKAMEEDEGKIVADIKYIESIFRN